MRSCMAPTCHCGHEQDEHGGDPNYPASFACNVSGCGCIEYEANRDDEDPQSKEPGR